MHMPGRMRRPGRPPGCCICTAGACTCAAVPTCQHCGPGRARRTPKAAVAPRVDSWRVPRDRSRGDAAQSERPACSACEPGQPPRAAYSGPDAELAAALERCADQEGLCAASQRGIRFQVPALACATAWYTAQKAVRATTASHCDRESAPWACVHKDKASRAFHSVPG